MKKRFLKLSALCLSAGISFAGISVTSLAAEEADAADPVGTIGFAQCSEYLNVRSDADKDAEVIGKLYNNGSAEILEADENGWYHIRSGNVDGYVSSEYIATGEEADEIAAATGYTTAEVGAISLNVRSEASETSDVVGSASESQELEVVAEEENGDWVKVVLPEGVYGYVSTEYVHVSTEYPTAVTLEEEQAAAEAESAAAENSSSEEQSYDQAQDDTYTEDTQWDESSADTAVDDSYAAADADTASEDGYTDTASEDTYTDTAAADTGSADGTYTDTAAGDGASTDSAAADTGYTDTSADSAAADTGYTDTSASDGGYTDETAGADTTTDTTTDTTASTGSATGQAIANYASQFVGNPYVWGGTSLTNGADCSGFVLSVFANFGISLPHSAASQAGYGTEVSYSDLQPGDLVFYSDGSGISHVAIYVGGGSIVHAANSSSGICYSNVDYSTPVSCRRLV